MAENYILFDLPSKQDNACWSPNTWKARAALNFKGVPYETVFVPYHELQPKLGDELGIPPNPEGSFANYTAPVVRFPDGSYVMESADIATKLEKTCPEPPLRLDDELQQRAQDVVNQLIFPAVAFIFSRVYSDMITDGEKDWFRNDREARARAWLKRDHITLEEWDREAGGAAALNALEPGMEQLSKLLKEHKKDDGPFIHGSVPCYADLIIVSIVEGYRRIGANDGAFEKLTGSVDGLNEFYEACEPWLSRNNH